MKGKLVRDHIPDIIRASGETPITRTAGPLEYQARVRAKLREEVAEFLESGDSSELADIFEVLLALAADAGLSREDLETLRAAKAAERGAFTQRIVWFGNASS